MRRKEVRIGPPLTLKDGDLEAVPGKAGEEVVPLTLKNGDLEAVPGETGEEVVPEVHRLEVLEAAEDPGAQICYAVPL